MALQLLIGSSKGLVILIEEKPASWKIKAVQFEGLTVSMIYVDERTATWWVGLTHKHWGEKLHYSKDKGKTWHETSTPSFKNFFYRTGQPATLRKIWTMQQAGSDRPNCLWLGTEPGGLFYSNDNGISWTLNESLWNHPSRLDDKQWFGTGSDFPLIHSILVDPRDGDHIYVAVSCAGIFETKDGGKSWQAKNNGLVAAYLPNPRAEVGHDPHKILFCNANPAVIWQQNHCGIFRSEDGGENWDNVSGQNGFPSYGFALTVDENNADIAWVIPAQGDAMRIPVDLKLTVCKTENGGSTWKSVSEGLPEKFSFDLVLRHAFAKHENTLAFGSNNGNLYVAHTPNEKWACVAQNLAAVNCLCFGLE